MGAVEETITVTADAPTVDVKNVRSAEDRCRATIIDSHPDRQDVRQPRRAHPGGDGQPSRRRRLLRRSEHVADDPRQPHERQPDHDGRHVGRQRPGRRQLRPLLQQGMVQEISVETGGMSAEHDAAACRSNLIPREGGNTFTGTLRRRLHQPPFQQHAPCPTSCRRRVCRPTR